MVLGVIYDPMMDECWHVEKGGIPYMNDHPMHCSRRERMAEAVVFVGHGKTDGSKEKGIERFARIAWQVRKVRNNGSAALALAYIACGRFDAYVESVISIWDVAAGVLLVEAAGGKVVWNRRKIIRNNSPLSRGTAASLSWRRWGSNPNIIAAVPYENMIALTGIGYDIHRFAEVPRPLMLGGVHIPSSRGLDGHSDADVLCHAIADALLGAAGLPDIGYWFPPGDPSCKDIPSLDIVAKAVSLIRERGGRIVNVDSSLIAESPRISPYLEQMKGALGAALGISPVRVGIKATTNEQLGALGRREGIAAFAVAAILMPEDLTMP